MTYSDNLLTGKRSWIEDENELLKGFLWRVSISRDTSDSEEILRKFLLLKIFGSTLCSIKFSENFNRKKLREFDVFKLCF